MMKLWKNRPCPGGGSERARRSSSALPGRRGAEDVQPFAASSDRSPAPGPSTSNDRHETSRIDRRDMDFDAKDRLQFSTEAACDSACRTPSLPAVRNAYSELSTELVLAVGEQQPTSMTLSQRGPSPSPRVRPPRPQGCNCAHGTTLDRLGKGKSVARPFGWNAELHIRELPCPAGLLAMAVMNVRGPRNGLPVDRARRPVAHLDMENVRQRPADLAQVHRAGRNELRPCPLSVHHLQQRLSRRVRKGLESLVSSRSLAGTVSARAWVRGSSSRSERGPAPAVNSEGPAGGRI